MEPQGITPFEQEVLRRLKRIDDALWGNGRRGVIETVGRLDERLETMEAKVPELSREQKSIWQKLNGVGTQMALIAYIVFDQKTRMGL